MARVEIFLPLPLPTVLSPMYLHTPELNTMQFLPMLQMCSVHNTPIEGLWHWFLQTFRGNIKDIIRSRFTAGIYNPNHAVHVYGAFSLYDCLFKKLIDKAIILLVMAEDPLKPTQ